MRVLSFAIAVLYVIVGSSIAQAQTWNLYDGSSSVYVEYQDGGHVNSPELNIGFDNSGSYAQFTMDTGSVGMVASSDRFQPGPNSKYLGPGQQVYSSSGIVENGAWYTATQQIYDGNGVVVATAEVPVLLVTSITCLPGARDCHPDDHPTGIGMMGIGFAREGSGGAAAEKTPAYNAFLNLTSVRLTPDGPLVPLPSNWNSGYVVTSQGVYLGLSSANTANAGFVKLKPNQEYSTAEHTEWHPAKMGISVNGTQGNGTVLMDTGVGVGYLTPPAGAVVGPLVSCGVVGGHNCAPNGTTIAVTLPGQTGTTAFFQYVIGDGSAMQPVAVSVDNTGGGVFFNTSRYVLQGLDYIYDAQNGLVGYVWKNAPSTTGNVNVMLALESDFVLPAGFWTSLPVTLFGETTLIPEGAAEFAGMISGDRKLIIDGPGKVVLSGNNDYTGETEVRSGTLSINGSMLSHVVVKGGGTLGGTGEVYGDVDVHAGGTYAPGNSIGTQIVHGNLRFSPGGVYAVEVDPTRSDRAQVHGSIDLTSAVLQLMIASGDYAHLTSYKIIDNKSGMVPIGKFAEIVNPLVFFLPTIEYDHGSQHDVVLTLQRRTDYSAVAQTPNERAVARALEKLPTGNPLIDIIQFQTLEGALTAFNSLSGEVYATTAGVVVDQSRYMRQTLVGRLIQAGHGSGSSGGLVVGAAPDDVAARPSGMMALGGRDDGWARTSAPTLQDLVFWTKAYGAWGDFDGNGNAGSASRTLGGVLTGADVRLDHGWRLGLATGYSQSSVHATGRDSSSSVDTVHVAAYGGGEIGPAVLRSGAAWGWNSIETNRSVLFPGLFEAEKSSYSGGAGQVFGELAVPMSWLGMTAEPFAGLAFVHVGTDGFVESGPVAGLTGAAANQNVGYSALGMRVASITQIGELTVVSRASLAWQHAYGDVSPEAALAFASGGSSFVVSGSPIAVDSALIETGLGVGIFDAGLLEVSYYGQLADNARDNAVEGRFKWAF